MKLCFPARLPRRRQILALATVLLVSLSLFNAPDAPAADTNDAADKAAAEQFYAQGSYARAHAIYQQMEVSSLSGEAARWVAFRRADTQWRAAAGTDNPDTSQLDDARTDLEKQIRDLTREDQHDRIWAEVQESLADFFWVRRQNNGWNTDWNQAWPHYQAALDWWAGQSDLALARQRYLNLVWRLSEAPNNSGFFYYWSHPGPLEIFENAARIAQSETDQAHAHYLLASSLRFQGGGENSVRVGSEFEAAIKGGRHAEWYEDALFNYAKWLEENGRATMDENGQWSAKPDYVMALKLFCQLTNDFAPGTSRYVDPAHDEIERITGMQLDVRADHIFLPGSEIQYALVWRNVKQIQLALYPVDLTRAVNFPVESEQMQDWLPSIDLHALKPLKSWTRETRDTGDHSPGDETVRLPEKLKPGAYLLEARAGDKSSRDLLLVSDATLVLKNSGRQALLYYCSALDGSPIAGARVQLWENWWANNRWHARSLEGQTDANGIFTTRIDSEPDLNVSLFASARGEDRQAFTASDSFWGRDSRGQWRIYAFTDRPAYQPKETVDWKFIARRHDGSIYTTPANQTIEYEITDPRGTKVKADSIQLNEFGSAFGTLDLTEKMPLGEYQVRFWNEGRHDEIGDATLFRLEEYKLPEFKVSVTTPEEDEKKKTFRLGETVAAAIQADYYFGGPVANADVNVVVHQRPYWHFWHVPRAYPWYYEDLDQEQTFGRWRPYGGEQIVTNATLKTDATGRATLSFETPQYSGQDFEYTIEARVTDASRREIIGSGTVRVTQQRYYIDATPAHNLYQPQDKVTVNFKALDANEQPVQSAGTVKITRDYWSEIWLSPDGQEVQGDRLKRLQAATLVWPPAPARPDQKPWRLKYRGYGQEEILTQPSQTGTNGAAEISFVPERDGYYRVAWSGVDRTTNRPPQAITAETTVWVARNRTTELGYRTGGVEIIADKDTFQAGGTAPVMLVSTTPNRYVLFTVEGEDLYDYQLVHLDGTVKLVNLPVTEKYVPNIFLGATLVSDRQIFTDSKPIVVPPVKNFLTVSVKPDHEQYQPRDEGTLQVTTRDDAGNPVPAEVALSLADESVFYIQNDYAGDPRQFFFGTKRQQQIQTRATMYQKNYVNLVEDENHQLMDDQVKARLEAARRDREGMPGGAGGGGGGGAGFGGLHYVTQSETTFGSAFKAGNQLIGGFGGSAMAASAPVESAMDAPAAAMRPATGMPIAGDMLLRAKLPEGEFPAATPLPGAAGEEPAVVVRSDFRSTIFWQPDVHTDNNGEATVKVTYPDSLTSWRATARAVTSANQFGSGEATTQTRQPLVVRLEAPRFFVVGDTVTVSAVVNNNLEQAMTVRPALETGGVSADTQTGPAATVEVPAHGETRADWVLHISQPGEIKLKVTARGDHYADAMEKTFTAYEHGLEKLISTSGKTRSEDTTFNLVLPHDRKAGSTSLTLQVTPSLAVTMLDALPYLIHYPYGCTEQTLSRFVPTVITARTIHDLGLRPEDMANRVFGGVETNTASATHPDGKQNLADMDKMTQAGLDRLYDFQHADGGWGWWKMDGSDHWMTAYVVWGLALAREAGVQLKPEVLRRGVRYLDEHLVDETDDLDMQAFMLQAVAACATASPDKPSASANKFAAKAFEHLWENREQLNAYTRALLALSAQGCGFTDQARVLVANLENGVIRDDRPDQSILTRNPAAGTNAPASFIVGTAHWGNDGVYWHWSDSGVEATAAALRALLAIDPTNALVEPVANWLVKNRRGAQWNNTRDTAMAVLALNDYLHASGELKTGTAFKILVNGTEVAQRTIGSADILSAPSQFTIDPRWIQDTNVIQIQRTRAGGSLYFSANARFFSQEEPIAPAGNELFVKREYYQLASRPTLLKGYVFDRKPLRDGDTVQSGDRVETVLTIETKNDDDYLMFEDLKPAGFEAVEIRSGEDLEARQLKANAVDRKLGATIDYKIQAGDTLTHIAKDHGVTVMEIMGQNPGLRAAHLKVGGKLIIPAPPGADDDSDYTGQTRGVYRELRDRQVALFIDHLPQGIWQLSYDFRAEVPGQFHALPVVGQAMYVPEIRGNSSEIRVSVADKSPAD